MAHCTCTYIYTCIYTYIGGVLNFALGFNLQYTYVNALRGLFINRLVLFALIFTENS